MCDKNGKHDKARSGPTPEKITAAYDEQKKRLPFRSPEPVVRVNFPSLRLRGTTGWLCHVCKRVKLDDVRPWSRFGCENCRAVDRKVAGLLGGPRLLPLGQHSIMNGVGIPLSASRVQAQAGHDQLTSMMKAWSLLWKWSDFQGKEMVGQWSEPSTKRPDSVPIEEWFARYPASRLASATTYVALLKRKLPWVITLEPFAEDVEWLATEDE